MSIWHTVKDIDDVQVSDDKTTLEILFNSDYNGNNYVEVPIDFVLQRLRMLVVPEITEGEIDFAIDKSYKQAGENVYFGNGFKAGIAFLEEKLTNN
jgi:hypothetical protein